MKKTEERASRGILHTVDITDVAYGGKGVGRIQGKVVFVPFTAPGDRVIVKITAEDKGFSHGVLKEIVEPSPMRVRPACPVYETCGGCSLQHIAYGNQVELKQRMLEESIKRIGGLESVAFDPPIASGAPLGYRTRTRIHVDAKGRWGFYEAVSRNVVDIRSCPVLDKPLNRAFSQIRDALSSRLKFGKKGCWIETVELGASSDDDKTSAAFYIKEDKARELQAALFDVSELKGIQVWDSVSRKKSFERGDAAVCYDVNGIVYKADISVFSQANHGLNRRLAGQVCDWAGLTGTHSRQTRVLELYSGAGNLTLQLARKATEVWAVESDPLAIDNARSNAAMNDVKNIRFHASDTVGWLTRNLKDLERAAFDVVILDPPRTGDFDAARLIAHIKPKRIVYVSCSPPTLARDMSALARAGYKALKAVLFDMFPQTYHVESIVGLEFVDKG
ncbi:MAG: class I SAM-dependent RNA methyltransferase [Deltaproteobacteria bacterium]|nr:class I SAM-dependent RNA methyltransferase [Deltaproteobacteria bacterium]